MKREQKLRTSVMSMGTTTERRKRKGRQRRKTSVLGMGNLKYKRHKLAIQTSQKKGKFRVIFVEEFVFFQFTTSDAV